MVKVNGKEICENCFRETNEEKCPHCGFQRINYVHDASVLAVGSVLSKRYLVGSVIGKGGFGITYLAYDMKLECRVAIKEYYPFGIVSRQVGSTIVSTANEETAETFKSGAKRFYEEARLVARFNGNPNIVGVHDFFYENETVYFTMDLLKGHTLKHYLKANGRLSYSQAAYVMREVSGALMITHSADVLHRDISPDNIMVCDDGTIKLLDFGAARQVISEGSQSLSVILKQGFAPLEQYQKKGKQGPWTDIYALGATIYYCITGDLLEDPMTRLDGDEEYESNKYQIPEEFWVIIEKATKLRMQDRYQDVFELHDDLCEMSIVPEPLVKKNMHRKRSGKTEEIGKVMTTEDTDGALDIEIPATMPLKEETEIPATMPLKEETEIAVTMPLKEEAEVSVTIPVHEEKNDLQPVSSLDNGKSEEKHIGKQDEDESTYEKIPEEEEIPQVDTEDKEWISVEDKGEKLKTKSNRGFRRICFVIGVAVVLIIFGFFVNNNRHNKVIDGVRYYINYSDHYVTVSGYEEIPTKVEIVSEVEGIPVTAVESGAFDGCQTLETIKIPDTVTYIGSYCFADCTSLSSVQLSSSLESIEEKTFSGCYSLQEIYIPNSVDKICYKAFENCTELTAIHSLRGVESVDWSAYDGCGKLVEEPVIIN